MFSFDTQPNHIHFSDNQFYNVFSNKYPNYFKFEKTDSEVFAHHKTCTSQNSNEIICESIIEAMKLFSSDIDKNQLNYENNILLNNYKEEIEKADKEYEEEHQRQVQSEDDENKDKVILKRKIAEPVLKTSLLNNNFMDTMVLFICGNKESNKIEQLNIINDLYSKQ